MWTLTTRRPVAGSSSFLMTLSLCTHPTQSFGGVDLAARHGFQNAPPLAIALPSGRIRQWRWGHHHGLGQGLDGRGRRAPTLLVTPHCRALRRPRIVAQPLEPPLELCANGP